MIKELTWDDIIPKGKELLGNCPAQPIADAFMLGLNAVMEEGIVLKRTPEAEALLSLSKDLGDVTISEDIAQRTKDFSGQETLKIIKQYLNYCVQLNEGSKND